MGLDQKVPLGGDQKLSVTAVPMWQASSFWVALCPNGTHLAKFVKDYIIFRPYFIAGQDMTNKAFKGQASFNMIALDCNFAVKYPFEAKVDNYFKLI